MHGRSEGCCCCGRRQRHMLSAVPDFGAASVVVSRSSSNSSHQSPASESRPTTNSSQDSFFKDGRKIRVGDCALFQAGNAPPFIGIIRWFTTGKEDCLELCVNWLYRPADLKLAKGILLEAAPNEVFYSFHKDVISAASLLHPCKVAFLRKGVELPSGISSFVCRRVYDIANKCLWWLTDQDYINERQEEVDQLLDKTRLEMHAGVQSGGRSPKPLNGPASTQQLKSGSDSLQNSGATFPSQAKGKKRERGDQGTEPIKRERPSKVEDGDSANLRLDTKAEVAKITEKGALITTEGVEKLVHFMQLDRNERKIDLAGRILIADVIAATDKIECLGKFVQLRGVPVLDEWLQEAHKGKTGDGNSPKESDKGTEELLIALLRALDRLPVNLNALQTCNIGKSVNHLRSSHKNTDIQKKARSLVDIWKKRVDAEMTKINDAKSVVSNPAVTWPVKPGFPEVSQLGSRRGGANESSIKNSITQPTACKTFGKPGHADFIVKSTPLTAGSLKLPSTFPASMSISSKESPCKGAGNTGASELPLATVKEEKSSSSSQSQNNSQSCSSDHAKTMGSSWKEDARSSTAGSMNASKTSGGSSRHRKSSNGFLGSSISGVQKEGNLGKSGSINKNTVLDKCSTQSGLSCERTPDMPGADNGNNHRLIVRLPNLGRSPARSASGGSLEDPSVTGSRASSPGAPDKHDHVDRKIKVKGDVFRSHISADVNAESWQSNDVKEGQVGSDECDRSPTAIADDERSRTADEAGRATDISKGVCSSSVNEKGGSLTEPKTRNSFSSMNALIESCAKYSEASAPLSAGDDIGMNLLASVAAGEMSKSDMISPSVSPGSSPAKEDTCAANPEVKSRFPCEDRMAQRRGHSDENADFDSAKQGKGAEFALATEELTETGMHSSGDSKPIIPSQENKLTSENPGQQHPVSSVNLQKTAELSAKPEVNEDETASRCLSVPTPADTKEELNGVGSPQSAADDNKLLDCTQENNAESSMKSCNLVSNCLGNGSDNDIAVSGGKLDKLVVQEPSSCPPVEKEVSSGTILTDQKLPSVVENRAAALDRIGDDSSAACAPDTVLCPEVSDEVKIKTAEKLEVNHSDSRGGERKDSTTYGSLSNDEQAGLGAFAPATANQADETTETKEAPENCLTASASHGPPSAAPAQEAEMCVHPTGSKSLGVDPERRGELASSAEASPTVPTSEQANGTMFAFDLNEGLPGDDGNQSEPATTAAPVCPPPIRLPSLPTFVSGTIPNGPQITVAAPAKGAFVPPENLLKSKGEPGWKGSAATSAFRPAEPRKILEMPLNTSDVQSSDAAAGKQGRPPLDIDLNVVDESGLEDMASHSSPQTTGSESGVVSNRDAPTRSSGGLDLDLNRVDEGGENGQFLASTSSRLEVPLLPVRPVSGGVSNGEANMFRDFDLNNGPGLDEVGVEPVPKSQHSKTSSSMQFLPPLPGLRMSNADLGNVSSWFPPGNSYPAVAIPSFLPDRGEQPYPIVAATGAQRVLGSVTGGGSFGGDVYRGPVLSSSPAMAFSPATAFPYAGFHFGSSFPLTSTSFSGGSSAYIDSSGGPGSCFPAIPSPHVAPAGAVSSHYARPYVVSLPEGSTSAGSESSRKWGRQGLDLNAGPGSADVVEVKDDRLPSASRQFPIEEQARLYQQLQGVGSKRKAPDGGCWDEKTVYRQSWH